jgi:hypothetical protein
MRDEERKLIQETFLSVRTYLVYPQDIREQVEEVSQKSEDIDTFIDEFKRVTSAQEDQSRKTDGQIFLNDLRRRMP